MAKKFSLKETLNLKEVAEQTQHFSGADLQSLLYNAQLEAVHQLLPSLQSNATSSSSSAGNAENDSLSSSVFKLSSTATDGSYEASADIHDLMSRVTFFITLHFDSFNRYKLFKRIRALQSNQMTLMLR